MNEMRVTSAKSEGIRFSIQREGKEVARAFLFLMYNDLHEEPFGFIEDVFVEEAFRGRGLGTEIVKQVIATAKEKRCYKLVCTSRYIRPQVHAWYEKLGFKDYGKEFRMDL